MYEKIRCIMRITQRKSCLGTFTSVPFAEESSQARDLEIESLGANNARDI